MKENPDWEIVDDDAQPQQRFSQQGFKEEFNQRTFLFSLLGKYPRLKLAGIAAVGIVIMVLVALFSLVVLTGAAVASALILLTAWLRAKFHKGKRRYAMDIVGK